MIDETILFEAIPGEPKLFVPTSDVERPLLSIVVPAMNEEHTIADFMDWCHEGLRDAGIAGEILIVDSSDDQTPQIALERGARVLRVPRRGLGRAYRDAIPFMRGQFVIMGDADCTYDFRELKPFIDAIDAGYEFVMGSRFRGDIEAGSMPLHHRYFGSPLTTLVLDLLLRTRFSDIHCGMRAVTHDALVRMSLKRDGWEYASEMIVKSKHLRLRSTEVPIRFFKDREGRISHLRRGGWLTPFRAGWHTLRVLFVGAADALLIPPGIALGCLGTAAVLGLCTGPVTIGSVTFTLHTQFLGAAVATIGWLAWAMGSLARTIYDPSGGRAIRLASRASFNRVSVLVILLSLLGASLDVAFVISFLEHGRRVAPDMETSSHLAVLGLMLLMTGFVAFTWMLVTQALADSQGERSPGETTSRPPKGSSRED
jgi:hypothetical protein